MDQFVVTKEMFPDFKLPKRPTEIDRQIQQIIDTDNKVVRVSREQIRALLGHYLGSKTLPEIFAISNSIVTKPANHMLWMLTSPNIKALYYKKQVYLNQPDVYGVCSFDDDCVQIRPGRMGHLPPWEKSSIFYHISVVETVIDGDYRLEVHLPVEYSDVGEFLKEFRPEIDIVNNAEETNLVLYGDQVANKKLVTTNPVLEDATAPSLRFAILPQDDDVLGPAMTVLAENADKQNFDLAELSTLLCVSTRTLQRRLKDAGTTFMKLKNEVRVNYITKRLSQGNTRETLSMMAGLKDIDAMHDMLRKNQKM